MAVIPKLLMQYILINPSILKVKVYTFTTPRLLHFKSTAIVKRQSYKKIVSLSKDFSLDWILFGGMCTAWSQWGLIGLFI